MKKCNRCGKQELGWNKPYFDKSGKWKLMDHKNKAGEWCIRNNFDKQEKVKITKKDYIICPLCVNTDFGYCRNNEYEGHKKMYHPNGEILTNKDFSVNYITLY